MAYETLIVEIEDYTCLIRLNRPDAMNALNIKLMSELAEAIGRQPQRRRARQVQAGGAFALGQLRQPGIRGSDQKIDVGIRPGLAAGA